LATLIGARREDGSADHSGSKGSLKHGIKSSGPWDFASIPAEVIENDPQPVSEPSAIRFLIWLWLLNRYIASTWYVTFGALILD
jgi:hypothetical protein